MTVSSLSNLGRAAFEMAPVPGAIVDLAGGGARIVWANGAFRALVGSVCEEGQLLSDALGGVESLPDALAKSSSRCELQAVCRGLEFNRSVTVQAVPLPSTEEPTLALVQVADMPALQVERALRESEKRLEEVADNVPALIYVKRADGRYLLVNRYFELEFGLHRGEVNNRTDFDIFPVDIASQYRVNDQRVLAAGQSMEFEEPRSRGGVYLSLKFPLFSDDGRPYAVGGLSTDISDRSRTEMAIRRARDEAERANREKNIFLSRMSHELRTPLNSIIGFGQLLQTGSHSPTVTANADRIVRAGDHLRALINEVLEISRIEQSEQPVSLAPVHACDPLREALELVRPLAAERGIELVADYHDGLHEFVLADYQRLEQVLLNLLSNAVKYNRDEGTVTVSFACTEDRLRYRVADTGHGLRESDLERIFTPFERLGAEASGIEGTGLGLALSKTLVEAMGGEIGVERSVPGRGSLFYVELALSTGLMTPPPRRPQRRLPLTQHGLRLTGATVLYIEDNVSNLELVREALAQAGGGELVSAADGRRGLELAIERQPDLILLDLNLPDFDGEELLALLRVNERTKHVPVIVLSADAMPKRIARLKDAGADDYQTKPLDVKRLLEALDAHINRPGRP